MAIKKMSLAVLAVAVAIIGSSLAGPVIPDRIATPERCVGGSCLNPTSHTYTVSVNVYLFRYGGFLGPDGYYYFGSFG